MKILYGAFIGAFVALGMFALLLVIVTAVATLWEKGLSWLAITLVLVLIAGGCVGIKEAEK